MGGRAAFLCFLDSYVVRGVLEEAGNCSAAL